MKSADVAYLLARDIFPFRRYVVVCNVSWGLLPWEADLVAMAPSGYLYETEIKVSVADLKRDAAKLKHRLWGTAHNSYRTVRGFYYAMPENVWEKVAADPPIPGRAGVITVHHAGPSRVVRKCAIDKAARPLSATDSWQLARLGCMRYWSRHEARNGIESATA